MAKYDSNWWFGPNSWWGAITPEEVSVIDPTTGINVGFKRSKEDPSHTFITEGGVLKPELLLGAGFLIVLFFKK